MSDEAPFTGAADALQACATRAAEERVATAVLDFFLPPRTRLSDRDRALMASMLDALVEAVEADLRVRVLATLGADAPPALAAALGSPRVPIAAPLARRAGTLRDPELIAVLLRRADEHRLAETLRGAAQRSEHADARRVDTVERLVAAEHDQPEVAAAAMDYLIAESRRLDAFGGARLARSDLPAEVQHRLTWRIAAALARGTAAAPHPGGEVIEQALSAAAASALLQHREERAPEVVALRLARLLHAAGKLSDGFVLEAVEDGHVALGLAAIAVRAQLDYEAVADGIGAGDAPALALVLCAIGMAKQEAASLAVMLLAGGGDDREQAVVAAFTSYEALDPAQAEQALARWRVAPAFRAARTELAVHLATAAQGPA